MTQTHLNGQTPTGEDIRIRKIPLLDLIRYDDFAHFEIGFRHIGTLRKFCPFERTFQFDFTLFRFLKFSRISTHFPCENLQNFPQIELLNTTH